MRKRSIRWLLGVMVALLALLGVGASATHYLQEPYNPGFLRFPTIVALHVVLGGIYLALAPFQFVKRIRSRHLSYHRRMGRLLVAVGLVVGVTALFLGLVIPFSGWPERVVIGLFGGLFLVALLKGFLHVRAGRVALHREWMIRAFAIGLSIATMRLIFIPARPRRASPSSPSPDLSVFRGGPVELAVRGEDTTAGPRAQVDTDLRQGGVDAVFAEVRVLLQPPHRLHGLERHLPHARRAAVLPVFESVRAFPGHRLRIRWTVDLCTPR